MSDHDSDKLSEKITAVANLAKAVPVYDDALRPVAIETGKALGLVGRAVNVALLPLRGVVWSAERVEQWLENKVATKLVDVRPENIITPDLQIAGPTIEALKFTAEKPHLQEMFAGVMAGAMNKDTCEEVHPSFVEKIKNLSELDATFFSYIAANDPVATLQFFSETKDIEGEQSIARFFNPNFCKIYDEKYPGRKKQIVAIESSIENLDNLGLILAIDLGELTAAGKKKEYHDMKQHPITQAFRKNWTKNETSFGTRETYIKLSSFGRFFAKTVL